MKPLDPRLLRQAAPARRYVALTAGLGLVTAALIVAEAILLASVLAPAVGHTATLADLRVPLLWLGAVFAARAYVSWLQERYGQRAGVDVVATLREQVVDHAARLGPRWLAEGNGPATATLVTRGLDDLAPYLTRYLPQLFLAATVTPATIAVVLGLDWISALIAIGTIPLVPIFMILIGRLTQGVNERRLAKMTRLGSQVLDLTAGLPTLRAFGREQGPESQVRALGDEYRRSTMGTLRIAFLSGMVLELLTTLSVAIIAVAIGLRLVVGEMTLFDGLAVLVLAPEIYLPLRQVGAHFHASADGLAATARAFEVLDIPLPPNGSTSVPPLVGGSVELRDVSVRAPGRDRLAPAHLSVVARSGQITALIGPNGSGKSTAIHALLGLVPIDDGRIVLHPGAGQEIDLAQADLPTWWPQVRWLPQRPHLEPGTILESVTGATHQDQRDAANTALKQAGPSAPSAQVLAAARLTGLDAVVATLPEGWSTPLGEGGTGLSVGQRQRVALTAALLDNSAPLVILDEPTAHLDEASGTTVTDTMAAMRAAGRIVIVVTHRPQVAAIADTTVEVLWRPLEGADGQIGDGPLADARSAAAPGALREVEA